VLTWNLMHGRAVPPAGRDLREEFTTALSGWSWDAALLQEVPPWWPPALAERLGAEQRLVLTSRNALLALRRATAERWPDMLKSNGGGANAILVRSGDIVEHRQRRLAVWPERRWMHAVRVRRIGGGDRAVWLANLHASAGNPGSARREAAMAADAVRAWAGTEPAVLGGDFNLRQPSLPGFLPAGKRDVDHIFAHGLEPAAVEVLERGQLSDHPPLVAVFDCGDGDAR
jgi:endonuclease/exonuclease/phosphatase family metal-dependent hydrolase